LDGGLAYALEACDFENFQTMVDKALVLENMRGILSRKHKQERQTQQSIVDVSYAAPQAHGIINVTIHREYSPDIIFIFS
jgi:hypothetical protein